MKRNFKRVLCLVVSLIVLMSIFAGCGKTSETDTSKAGESTQAATAAEKTVENVEPTEFKFLHWRVEDLETMNKINEDFQKENPNIKIAMDTIPTKDYANVLNVRLSSGEVDLFGIDPFGQAVSKYAGIFASADSNFLDLTDQPFLKNYIPSTITTNVTYNGKVYGVPTCTNNLVTYYNKDLFKKMNLEIPRTYSAFIELCKKIKAENLIPLAFGGKDGWPIALYLDGLEPNIVRGKSPEFYTKLLSGEKKFTDPEFVDVLKKVKEMYQYTEPNAMGVGYGDAPNLFTSGKAAMLFDGSWTAGQIASAKPGFEVGVFTLPGDENEPTIAVKFGMVLCVSKQSTKQEASLKYLDYISRKDVYAKFVTGIKQMPTQAGVSFEGDPLMTAISSLPEKSMEFCDQWFPAGYTYDWVMALQKMVMKETPEKTAEGFQSGIEALKKAKK